MITKASPVVVELLFIPLLDVYSIPSRSQLIDWAEALSFILLHWKLLEESDAIHLVYYMVLEYSGACVLHGTNKFWNYRDTTTEATAKPKNPCQTNQCWAHNESIADT